MHKNADWYLISSLFFVCQMSTSISCLPAFTSACLKGCFYMCPSQGLFLHLPFSKGVFTAVCLKGCFYICLSQGLFLHLSASRGDFTSVCLKGWFYICPSQGVFLHLSQGVFFTSVSRGVFTSACLKGWEGAPLHWDKRSVMAPFLQWDRVPKPPTWWLCRSGCVPLGWCWWTGWQMPEAAGFSAGLWSRSEPRNTQWFRMESAASLRQRLRSVCALQGKHEAKPLTFVLIWGLFILQAFIVVCMGLDKRSC